jgi:PAS domain S-box-containing protein
MKLSPRTWLRNLPIHRQMVIGTLTVCAIGLVMASTVLFWFESAQYRKSFVTEMESLAAITAQHSIVPLATKDASAADNLLAPFKLKPQIVGAYIFDADNAPFGIFRTEEPNAAIPAGTPEGTVAFADGYAIIRVPIVQGNVRLGTLHLRANFRKGYVALLTMYAGVLSAAFLGSSLLILLLSSRMQKLIAEPIVALAKVARDVTESQDYSRRAVEAGRDEVGRLTHDFNRMLEQIQSREIALRETNRSLQTEITERKLAQASQARLIAIVEGTTDFVGSATPDGRCLFVNSAGLRMAGFGKEVDVASLRIPDFHPAWAARIIVEEGLPAAASKGSWMGETAIVTRDGQEIPISQLIMAHRGAKGEVEYYSTVARDLRDSRLAAELKQSQQRYEVAVLGSSDGLWDWDLKANEVYFAPRWKNILGYTEEELPNRLETFHFLLHPDEKGRIIANQQEYLASHASAYEAEFRMRHKDGSYRWILSRGAALRHAEGEAFRFAGSHTDITERKLAGEQMVTMQKELLEVSRKAGMAEVATGVLHNVGNVLNSVCVSASLMREQLTVSKLKGLVRAVGMLREQPGDLGAYMTQHEKGKLLPNFFIKVSEQLEAEQQQLQKELNNLGSNLEHVKEIVAMQQNYAKVAGVIETLSPRELMEDAVRMNEVALNRHGVNLVRDFHAVPEVAVDKHKVLQVLTNLIRNAKYATDNSPTSDKQITLRIVHPDNNGHVQLSVIDNGLGIAPENMTRIFGGGFTTKKEGHGFGLHSSANAAKEMGGRLFAESEGPGKGATFTLELPVKAAGGRSAAETVPRRETVSTA